MCGIHGFINGKTAETNADDFIKSGCVAGMLRGMDSTGVAVVDTTKKQVDVRKLPLPGNYFIEDKQFVRLLPAIRSTNTLTIAHTRAATQGRVNAANAHPFLFRDGKDPSRQLVGVHNGTLTGWLSNKGANEYDVDSQWALSRIFEEGIDAFKLFNGAYCFVWWDSRDPTIVNMARNDQRPLSVGFTKKGGLAFASEAGMIDWLADRHRIDLDGDIKALKPGILYKIDTSNVSNIKSVELPKYKYQTTTTTTTNNSGNRWNGSYNSDVCSAVDALLKKVKEEEDKSTAVDPAQEPLAFNAVTGEKKPSVTKEEMNDAKVLEVLHQRVPFKPSHTDNKTDLLYGTVTFEPGGGTGSWEADAIMRHASNVKWKPEDTLEVTVLGASFGSNDVLIIVSKPRVNLSLVGKAAEDADTAVAH